MGNEPPEFEQDEVNSEPSVTIDLTPEFSRNLRDLAKRYRHLRADIQTVIQDLEIGNFVGDRISGIGEGYATALSRHMQYSKDRQINFYNEAIFG